MLLVLITAGCNYPAEFNPLLQLPAPEVRGIDIVCAGSMLRVGDTARAEAYLILERGDRRPAADAEWESLNPGVISVDGDGTVTGRSAGTGRIRVRAGGFTAERLLEVRPRPDYSCIKISEVLYDPEGNDAGREYIELRNAGGPCDLAGLTLVDGAASSRPFIFPAGCVMDAGSFIVIAASRDGFFDLFGAWPDCDGFSFGLNNNGETVVLAGPDGAIIDAVYIRGGTASLPAPESWGSFTMPAAAAGDAVHRVDHNDTDTAWDWTTGPPTPGG